MHKTIITVLLTSLFWAFVIFFFFELKTPKEEGTIIVNTEQSAPQPEPILEEQVAVATTKPEVKSEQPKAPTVKKSPKTIEPTQKATTKPTTEDINYALEIDGMWTPVEGAMYPLEITKYNVAIQHRSYKNRVNYSLKGRNLKIQYDNARCEITKQGENYFLEIYNSQDFSGKYKRTSQPRKIDMRPLDQSLYSTAIIGKWSVINGQEYPLEFSKYGTAIQSRSYEVRVDYTLNGNALNIQYDSARVVISEDASYYYLEIYNSQDFSGRYRRLK